MKKMHENVNKLKKEGYLGLTYTWGQKPLKIWGGKRQKILDWIGWERKRRKEKKTIWKSEEHMLRKPFNFISFRNSIGQVLIGYQLNHAEGFL